MSHYNEVDEIGWKMVKWFFIVFGIVALLGALGWVCHVAFYPVDQAQQLVERTMNADNIIYNYEWFHTRFGDYQSADTQIHQKELEVAEFLGHAGPRETWNLATQREESQLRVELSGIRSLRTNIANEYNSHVGMANRDLFRSHSLPDHLNDN